MITLLYHGLTGVETVRTQNFRRSSLCYSRSAEGKDESLSSET